MIPPPRQGGGGTKAPALTYVVTCAGLVVHVVVSVAGGFMVKCCRFPAKMNKNQTVMKNNKNDEK